MPPPTPPPHPDLSIIIISWNVRDLLRDCLRSIERHTHRCTYDVWVVDNGSQDGTPAMLREDFPTVNVIANAENIGFARATNLAYTRATGRTIALLNPDTVLLNDAFDRMIAYLDDHPGCGAAGPRLLNADGTLQVNCARDAPTLRSELQRIGGKAHLSVLQAPGSDHPRTVEVISGACMMVRRTGFEGELLNEAYFMYGEDLQLCWEIRERLGRTIAYLPDAEVCHLGQQSSQQAHGLLAEDARSVTRYFHHAQGPMAAALVRLARIASALIRLRRHITWRVIDPTTDLAESSRAMRELWGVVLWGMGLRPHVGRRRPPA